MSFSARFVLPVLFTIFTFAVFVCAQTTTKQSTKTPRGSVSGRVTIKDKGAAGVAVGLRKGEQNFPPFEPFTKTITDHDGYYRFGNLAPGTYEVVPSAPAYVVGENNNQRNKAVIVGEDEPVDGINFSLVRGGVITGKVTDADGRAVILQQVSPFRTETFEQQGQQRPMYPLMSVTTDDRGVYRMYGLSPGRYKVAAGRSDDANAGVSMLSRSSYKQVFHPDVTDHTRATIIEVREGTEANDVDITLGRPMQTFSASGKVIDGEKGVPIPNLRFGLQRVTGQRFEMVPMQVASNALGDFLIEGLIPGKYNVYLYQGLPQSPYPDMRAESLTFDVVDQDVTGLTVRLLKGGSLSGVVVLESDDKAVHQKFQQLQLRAYVAQGSGFGQSSMSPISPDGSFRLGGLGAGTANMYLTEQRGPLVKGFVIARVERDGILAPQRGVELKDGEHVTGLRVFVAHGTASIRGVVKIENGSLPPEAQIYVRLTKPGENFSNIQPPRVDTRGRFLMESLPAGTYELHASIAGARTASGTVKQEVILQDGVVTDVVVTINLGTTPK